jgi:hypothetical protein
MKQSYRDFSIYETHLKNLINNSVKLKDYNLRIYVDSSTKNNKVLDYAKNIESIEIIEYECKNFKIDEEYYNGTFGTIIRLYPLFNIQDDYEIVRVSDIDLQFNTYFTGREERTLINNNLNFLFLKYIPYIKPWSNPEMNHSILAGFILSRIKFPRDMLYKYLEDLYLILNNNIETELSHILNKIIKSTNYKYTEKNIYLPYGVDELFLNYRLYPYIKRKKYIKYGMKAELFPSQLINIIKNSPNLSKEDQNIINKLKYLEEEIYFKKEKDERKFIYAYMIFVQKFKNKISDYYDELLEEVNKYKNNFKDHFVFFLLPK